MCNFVAIKITEQWEKETEEPEEERYLPKVTVNSVLAKRKKLQKKKLKIKKKAT